MKYRLVMARGAGVIGLVAVLMLYGSVTAPASEAQQAHQPEPSTAEEFEVVLLAELEAAGFEGFIATDGYEDAEASVFVDGGEVFIHTYADGDTVRGRRAALDGATLLAGTRVETGTWDVEGNPPIWRFVCGTKEYEVVGDGLLPINSIEWFIITFLAAQPCGEPDASFPPAGEVVFDGDPHTTERIDVDDPLEAAIAVSQLRYPGDRGRTQVVLARVDVFADALAGAPLTVLAPLLFSEPDQLPAATLEELRRVATPEATVYMLGGEAALSAGIEQQLAELGYLPLRLGGASRVETSVKIARLVDEMLPGRQELAVARSHGPADDPTAAWADSISGGAFATHVPTPIVLTPTDSLHPAVKAFAEEIEPTRTYVFGGSAAITDAVAAELPNPARVAGPNRAETASNLVGLYGNDVDRFIVVNGYQPDGWTFGLLAAGIAAHAQSPVLFGDTEQVPTATLKRHEARPGSQGIDTLLLGGTDHLGPSVPEQLDTE
jgi:putative cell wall-binding protein